MSAHPMNWEAEAYLRLGEEAQLGGDFVKAVGWYEQAREHARDHEAVLFNLAVCLIATKRPDEAISALDDLDATLGDGLDAEPMRFASQYNRVLARAQDPDAQTAREEGTALVELLLDRLDVSVAAPDPNADVLGRLEGAATSLLAQLQPGSKPPPREPPPSRRDLLTLLGRPGVQAGERAAALEAFARAAHGADAGTRYNLAHLAHERGDQDAAAADLHDAEREPALAARSLRDPVARSIHEAGPSIGTRRLGAGLGRRPVAAGRMRTRLRRAPAPARTLGALALVTALAVTLLGLVGGDHPLVTGAIGGAVVLSAGALAVVEARRRAGERRWLEVRGVAFKALAYGIGELADGMYWLVTGEPPRGDERHPLENDRETLRRAFATARLPPPKAAGEVERLTWDELVARLIPLLDREGDWRHVSLDVLDALRWGARRSQAEAAVPLLGSPELIAVLVRIARLDDDVSRLQAGLREPGPTVETIQRWGATLAEAISLREDLMRAAGAGVPQPESLWTSVPEARRRQLERRAAIADADETAARALLTRRLIDTGSPPSA